MELLDRIAEELEYGEDQTVAGLTREAVDSGVPAHDILNAGLLKGMAVVGEKFKNHEIFLPEVLLSARAMQAGMELVKPLLIRDGVATKGKVIIGTVEGDMHDIGKNLVGIMLKGAGYEVVDLGFDVPAARFVETAKKENGTVIGLSALLTTTMPRMREVVELLKEHRLLGRIKVIIGGAPVSRAYADQIGAHMYAYDGANAVQCIDQLLHV